MVTIISPEGESKVALDSLKQEIPEISLQNHLAQNPIEQIRQDLSRALSGSGYDSKESIIELVRDIKKEMLAEQESH
jgi:hypothetical protein